MTAGSYHEQKKKIVKAHLAETSFFCRGIRTGQPEMNLLKNSWRYYHNLLFLDILGSSFKLSRGYFADKKGEKKELQILYKSIVSFL